MTDKAKQKAEELYELFGSKVHSLLCVEQIINEAHWWHSTSSYEESGQYEGAERKMKFLQQVKQHLEEM